MKNESRARDPQRIGSYFLKEWRLFLITAVSGILCNASLSAVPWLEGRMVQQLFDVLKGTGAAQALYRTAVFYLLAALAIQGCRCLKRLYVRRFSNSINRSMKELLYRNLLAGGETGRENTGTWLTKAISDVDACSEGIRKFTTELFDSGVVAVSYLVMLLAYDWRLALLSCLFPPLAFLLAQAMKKTVVRWTSASKESTGVLNNACVDRVGNALTYRVYGAESARNAAMEQVLDTYETLSVRADLWENTLQPVYKTLSMAGTFFILWLGGRNVLGLGRTAWDLAAFTTFLSCFERLSEKISKSAKLLNSVQKARVSWERIRPYLKTPGERVSAAVREPGELRAEDLTVRTNKGEPLLEGISFAAAPGQIIGITGEVASGKSSLGRVFLGEQPYEGRITFAGEDYSALRPEEGLVSYLGHDPELFSDSILENVLLTEKRENDAVQREHLDGLLSFVSFDRDLADLPDGTDTCIGSGGVRLSGGQQARIGLARTLEHRRPLMVLDDPFASVDRKTEEEIFARLREQRDTVILLISHRLSVFDRTDGVLFLEDGRGVFSTHARLLAENGSYRKLVALQEGNHEEK